MHSPEPWSIGTPNYSPQEIGFDDQCWIVAKGHGFMVARTDNPSCLPVERNRANAQRIVACVNACADIPTNVLEHNRLVDGPMMSCSAEMMEVYERVLRETLLDRLGIVIKAKATLPDRAGLSSSTSADVSG